jgi:hypothetical protein
MLALVSYGCEICKKQVNKDANLDYYSRDSKQVPP